MSWLDVAEYGIVNLDHIVRAYPSEDGLGTYLLHSDNESSYIPMQFATFKAIVKIRHESETSSQEATTQTLQKILSGQSTMVP